MPTIVSRLLLVLGLLGPALQGVQAQEVNADLYDAVAPANSAFVRVLNLSPGVVDVSLSSKKTAQKVGPEQLGAYRFTPPGKTLLSVGAARLETDLQANSASTLLYANGSLTELKDIYVNEPKKAQLAFYNLTDTPTALKTADGKQEVVAAIGKAQTGGRMVNEFKIAFAAYAGDRKVASFDEMFLKKGRSYSYVLLPEGSGYRAISQANAIDPAE
jgi:alginate O-acetyltransferase complex protein AlgF